MVGSCKTNDKDNKNTGDNENTGRLDEANDNIDVEPIVDKATSSNDV